MVSLVALGDSILEGWDGHEDVPRDRTIPKTIGKINGWNASNRAIGGTQFGGNNSFDVISSQTNFFGYDIVLVGYGVNDWCYPAGPLSTVKDYIVQGINNIHNTHPGVPIFFELPTEDFRNGSTSLDDRNSRGWSQNDLCNLIKETATENGCGYYDWRDNPLITLDNHTTTLGDGQVHPTQVVMDQMAQRLAPALKDYLAKSGYHSSDDDNKHNDQPVPDDKPSKGPIQMQKLVDPFKLADCFNANAKTVVETINQIYNSVGDLYGMESVKKVDALPKLNASLNRALRDGVINFLLKLQKEINDLIRFCNEQGIIDMITGKTDTITLDPPRLLTLDGTYQNQYNAQWQAIGEILNKLLSYLKEAEGVK